MKKAGRRWKNALPWICFLCLALTIAMGVYTYRYEPDRYCAVYTFYALPTGVKADENALQASRMLARDCNALLKTEPFRQTVLAKAESDGMTCLSALGVDGTHMIEVSATGVDRQIVFHLAQEAGARLMEQAGTLFHATDIAVIAEAALPTAPVAPNRPLRIAAMLLASFGVLSLLGLVFGSSRLPVRWGAEGVEQLSVRCIGGISPCQKALRRYQRQKQPSAGGLSALAGSRVQEDVRETALALRNALGKRGCSVTLTAMEEEDPLLPLLLAAELAQEGFDVLLMEMDSYSPGLGALLGVRGQLDALDCLTDETALRGAILPTAQQRLYFMDMCHAPGCLATFAAGEAFASFVEDASHSFDYVLLNAPPAVRYSDGAMLGAQTDMTVLSAADGRFDVCELQDTISGLENAVRRLGGLVLTAVRNQRRA